jgi:hypothetical protein
MVLLPCDPQLCLEAVAQPGFGPIESITWMGYAIRSSAVTSALRATAFDVLAKQAISRPPSL